MNIFVLWKLKSDVVFIVYLEEFSSTIYFADFCCLTMTLFKPEKKFVLLNLLQFVESELQKEIFPPT